MTKKKQVAAMEAQEAVVYAMVLAGQSRAAINAACLVQFKKSADPIIAETFAKFEGLAAENPAQFMGFALEAFRDVYRRALAAEDLPTALRAVKEIRDTALKMTEFEF